MPLLFEVRSENFYDILITEKTEAKGERTERLLPIEKKIKRSHFVIENNGSLADLKNR